MVEDNVSPTCENPFLEAHLERSFSRPDALQIRCIISNVHGDKCLDPLFHLLIRRPICKRYEEFCLYHPVDFRRRRGFTSHAPPLSKRAHHMVYSLAVTELLRYFSLKSKYS